MFSMVQTVYDIRDKSTRSVGRYSALIGFAHLRIGWSLVVDIALTLAHGLVRAPLDEAAQVDVTDSDQLISGRIAD